MWDVDHMKRPDDDCCPVCGEPLKRAVEQYPDCEVTLNAAGRTATWCVQAGVASASPDPTLIIFEHE